MSSGTFTDPQSLIYSLQVSWSLAAAEACLYGGYFVLVAFYLHVLRIRGVGKQRSLMSATMVLFALCTIHCALVLGTAILGSQEYIGEQIEFPGSYSQSWIGLSLAANWVYVVANVIADGVFIYRCYAIWNFRLRIVLLPIFLTLGVAGVGCFAPFAHLNELGGQAFFNISIAISLATTFVLMGLTVGRIWWLARAAQQVMGTKVARKYYTVCAMILESGALYFMGGLVFVILGSRVSLQAALRFTVPRAVLGQLVGIAPTIIAVRVGLGYSVETVHSFVAPTPPTRL